MVAFLMYMIVVFIILYFKHKYVSFYMMKLLFHFKVGGCFKIFYFFFEKFQ